MSDMQKKPDLYAALERMKPAIASALPKHCSPDRMARIALTALRTVPKLAECTPQSFFGAIMQASQLGLEVCSPLGMAYIIPYGTEATLIIGFQGLMDLARRSGMVKSIRAHEVCENDAFSWELGLDPKLYHKPSEGERGRMTHVYAVAKLSDGEPIFTVLTMQQVDSYRARSRASKSGPWVTDYESMARKTAVRRLFTWLPKSAEMAQAVQSDDASELDSGPTYSPEVQHVLASLPEPAPAPKADPVPEGTPEGQRVPAGSRQRTSKAKVAPSPEPAAPAAPAAPPAPPAEDVISKPGGNAPNAWTPSWKEIHEELARADAAWEGEDRLPLVIAFTDAERKSAWEWAYRVNQGWAVPARPAHTKPPRAPGEDG